MTENIVSSKKRIPIATRDFCVIDQELFGDDYQGHGFLPHNLFVYSFFGKENQNDFNKSITVYEWSALEGNVLKLENPETICGLEGEITDSSLELAQACGVYFCCRAIPTDIEEGWANEIVYVGKTNNIYQRFSQHHKKKAFEFLNVERIFFIAYSSKYYSESDVLWAERQYIEMLKPILNDRHCLGLLSSDETESKTNAIQEVSTIWDMAYNEGLKHGFASAKNQMMDFFDSAIQPPKLK